MNFIKNYWWVFLLIALAAFAYWYFEKKTPGVVAAGDTPTPGKLQIPGLGDDLVIAPTSGTGVVGDEMA